MGPCRAIGFCEAAAIGQRDGGQLGGNSAWSLGRREVSAGPLQKAFSQLLLLAWGEQITAQCQGQPQRSHQFERFNKAHAQHWCLPLGRVGSLSGQQGAGQDDGGDFLGAGFQGVALQDVGFAQLAFEFPVIQLVFPALRIQLDQFEGGCGLWIEQAGPQTQLDRAKAGALDARADFAHFQPLDNDALIAFLLQRHAHQPAAILQTPEVGLHLILSARIRKWLPTLAHIAWAGARKAAQP